MRFEQRLVEPNFRIGNIVTVSLTRDKGYRHSYKNGREKFGFVYIIRGSLTESFSEEDGGEMTVYPGEVLFVPKGRRYVGIYGENNTEAKIIQFDLITGELPSYLSSPTKILLAGIGRFIEQFFSFGNGEGVNHPFYYLSRMYELLFRIDEYYADIPQKYKKLRPAISHLQEKYSENLPVSKYALMCGMSEVSFRRAFREYTGCSPIEYRNDQRLKNAKALLESGEYSVSETAYLSGFSNLSFFSKLYKEKHGHTPKKGQN